MNRIKNLINENKAGNHCLFLPLFVVKEIFIVGKQIKFNVTISVTIHPEIRVTPTRTGVNLSRSLVQATVSHTDVVELTLELIPR